MTRIFIGIILIILMVTLKVLLNHNIDYWASVKSWSIIIGLIGTLTLAFNIFEKIDTLKPRSFRMYPIQGLLFLIYLGVFLTAQVYTVLKLEDFGEWGNRKLKEYYLTDDTLKTNAVVIGDKDIYYTIKYKRHTERFTLIEYHVDDETIVQGIRSDNESIAGDSIEIVCSQRHPTSLRLGN